MNNSFSEFSLLDTETQNIETSLELFEIIKQTAEEYCSYVKKYKEYTTSYFDKLSKLTYNNNKTEIKNKNIKISPIYSILKKVPKLIQQQIEGLKKFVDSFDLSLKPLENILNNELNSLEEPKKIFEENKKVYQKNKIKHNKLMEILSSTEKKIIKYYVSKKVKESKEEKEIMDASLIEAKNIENDFLSKNKEDENYHWLFQENSLKNIEIIKSKIRTILENLNNNIIFFLFYFNEFYSPSVSYIQKEIEKIKTEPINFLNLIKDIMKIKTYKLEELPSDKYNIKILETSDINALSYSVDNIDIKDNIDNINRYNTFSFFNFISKNNIVSDEEIISKLNKMDVLDIVKKLYKNFKMINKNKYNIEIEEEKINTKNLTDKLLLMKKFKKKKNYKYSEEDKINEKEKKYLFSLIEKKECRLIFLNRLNKVRTFGIFEYKKNEFNEIIKILLIILDKIELDKDYFSFQFCIILSQTFYLLENEEKIYMYKYIKSHKIFKSEEIWRNLIEYSIKEETEKYNKLIKKLSVKRMNSKFNDMIFAQLLSLTNNMIEFDLNTDITEKIILENINKYNLKEESKKIILDVIHNKKIDKNEKIINCEKNKSEEEKILGKENEIEIINKNKEENKNIKENEIKETNEDKITKEENKIKEDKKIERNNKKENEKEGNIIIIKEKMDENNIKEEKKENEKGENIIKEENKNK